VSLIDHATIQIDLTDQSESIVGAFPYVLCDEAGEPVDAVMVTTNVEEVNLSVKIQRIKEVPLKLTVVDGGGATADTCTIELQRETDTIWVSGSENKLRDLNEVELGTIHLAELKKDSNTLTFPIVLPEGVTNMTGESEVTVVVTFPALSKKKLTISKDQFQSVGVPAGSTVNWITEVVEVELRGPKDAIMNITEKDLTVTMDFADEELGNVSKVPKITLSNAYPGVGAISVSTVTAALQQTTTANAAVG
jgi:hypothetical protein